MASVARRLWRELPRGSTLPEDVWVRRHHGILVLLWLHVPVLLGFALLQGESLAHSVFEMSVVASIAAAATAFGTRRRPATVLAAIGLLTCSAELVHLSGGVIEMHFHFFVMVGVITLYQDWWPFLIAIGYVVVQHGLAGALSPETVYNHQAAIDHPWRWAGIHGLFILGMSAAGIVSWRLNERLLGTVSVREEKLAEAQQLARLGSWEWDVDSGRMEWSDEMFRLLGAAGERVPTYETFLSRVHPDDRAKVDDAMSASLDRGEAHALDFRVALEDDAVRWLHGRGEVLRRRDGRPVVVAGTAQDVTERRRSEDSLRAVETDLRDTLSVLSATLDSTADGILVVNADGEITSFNQKFSLMWRLPERILASRDDDEAIGFVLEQLVDPEAFVAKVKELYAQPGADSHDTLVFKDGRVFERYSTPQRVAGVIAGRVWSFRDVTQRKQLEDELAHQAFHDSLTKLANQALFRDRLDHALTRTDRGAGQLAVLFVDVDNFKTVNDSLGHTTGDRLLVAVAERLRECLRAVDTAARLGGDEFAVLLEALESTSDATDVADRLITALRRPFAVAGREVFVSVSIGIAFDEAGAKSDVLLRNADLAMYRAKSRGKGRYEVYELKMHAAAVERLEMEADLRRAIDRGELTVHYQPIVRLVSGEVYGVEALVRWQHTVRGLLSPATFIPLAEETGLIQPIGRHVLREACRQARQWQVENPSDPPLAISVNLSPRQLQHEAIVEDVASALRDCGLPPASLILEITEGAVMDDPECSIARLDELKRLGVRLALDDFGTGYSSLSYLQRFPVDILKIDRSFVQGITGGSEESALVRAILRLAATLQMDAVAEGVEGRGQIGALVEFGCDLAQGFHLAMPQAAEAIGAWLRDARRDGALPGADPVPTVGVSKI